MTTTQAQAAGTPAERRSLLERFLSLFVEVRAGEAATALLMAVTILLVFVAYYIIKPVREALILSGARGAELKSYAAAGQALLLLFVAVPLYARLASRVPRRRLLNTVNLFFIVNMLIFYVLALTVERNVWLGLAFYIWVGIFNLMVPAQFWSLANDVYTQEEGKRLFVIVAFGASAGAVLGGLVTKALVTPLGASNLLPVSAGIMLVATLLTSLVERREHERHQARAATQAAREEAPLSRAGAFRLVFRTRYLLAIAFLVLFLNWVNTNGEFILGNSVSETYKRLAVSTLGSAATEAETTRFVRNGIASFYAGFFTTVNITGLLVQLFLVSRILKYLGLRVAILVLPMLAFAGYTLLALAPVLGVIRLVKTAENATDYSLQNTVRQSLFLPTTREEKYKAKQATDTFFWRAGDLLSAGLVYVGLNVLQLSTKGFAFANMALVVVWMLLAVAIGKEYVRRTSAAAAKS